MFFDFASAVNMHKLWRGKVPATFDDVATPAFVVDRACSKAGSEANPRYNGYKAIRLFGRYPVRTLIAQIELQRMGPTLSPFGVGHSIG